jgi:hypothetical protein
MTGALSPVVYVFERTSQLRKKRYSWGIISSYVCGNFGTGVESAKRWPHCLVTSTPLEALFVSIVTLAEIRYGIDLNPDAQKRVDLQEWLTVKVRPMFDPVWPEYRIALVPLVGQALPLFAAPVEFAFRAATGAVKRGADVAGQPPALTVGEPQSSSAELFSQNAILLAQIVNCVQLALVHPARQGDQQETEGVQAL